MSKSINKETRGASVKKIVPDPSVHNGLVLANLTGVELGFAEIREDSDWIDFRSKKVPRVTFIFTEKVSNKDKEEGMYFKSYTGFPEPFDKDLAWQWDVMAQTIKHFIDVFSENDFKDEYADLLDLPLEEGKEYEADEKIKAWDKFMKGVVKVFNGDTKKGLPKLIGKDVWMKLLVDVKGKQVSRGDFALPGYPGNGVVELYKEGVTPSIRINIAKGESIIPKAYEEPTVLGDISGAKPGGETTGQRPAFMES